MQEALPEHTYKALAAVAPLPLLLLLMVVVGGVVLLLLHHQQAADPLDPA
jgi:hypothetical protein